MNLANKLTLFRIALVPVFIIFTMIDIQNNMLYALIVFLVASATDYFDGYIARKYNLITDMGKFMDPLADKLLVTAAFVMFIQLGKIDAWIVFIIIAREFAVTGLRGIAATQNVVIAASFFGKIKTVVQMATICILLLNNYPFSLYNFPMDQIAIYTTLIVTVLSGYDYFGNNLKNILNS